MRRHAKSTENPEWPHESYCVECGEEWPCAAVRDAESEAARREEREQRQDWRNDSGV